MNQIEITLNDIKLWVDYDYEPGEPPSYGYEPGGYYAYSGSPEHIDIKTIYVDGTDWNIVSEISAVELEEIEQHIKRIEE